MNKTMDEFDFVLEAIDRIVNKYLSTGKASLTGQEKKLLAVWFVDSEVNNGGFDQFYWNSFGDLALEAVLGFSEIGAVERASIVKAANAEFPNEKPAEDREIRQTQLDEIQISIHSRLNSLNDEYYSCKENVSHLLAEYLKKINEK